MGGCPVLFFLFYALFICGNWIKSVYLHAIKFKAYKAYVIYCR